MATDKLTVGQESFCRKYLELGEATKAYLQAVFKIQNYTNKSLWEAASYLLAKIKVRSRVNELKAEAAKEQDGRKEESAENCVFHGMSYELFEVIRNLEKCRNKKSQPSLIS